LLVDEGPRNRQRLGSSKVGRVDSLGRRRPAKKF
jgi:hypothetical protein